jgi:hypothetical protein
MEKKIQFFKKIEFLNFWEQSLDYINMSPQTKKPIDSKKPVESKKVDSTPKNKPKTKKPKMVKEEIKLSPEDQQRRSVYKMYNRPQTYDALFYKVNTEGSSEAGEVIAMRIRAGYVRKDEVQYLREKLEGNRNPILASAQRALAQVVL